MEKRHQKVLIMKRIKGYVLLLLIAAMLQSAYGQEKGMFRNPIIPGGHPDPSICRVEDNYYLVTSSFIWFPGVPIYQSKDLVNWKLIGHAFERPSSLNINDSTGVWGGIWAPTIRYHQGLFYITVTQRSWGDAVLVTSQDPAKQWSDPITLHSRSGIDGSLLFDDDHIWYCWSEDHKIWFQELDGKTLKLVGEKQLIMDELRFEGYTNIEGPHIYKLENGEYMLLIAAGGTGSNKHNVSVFKSDQPNGPYQPCPQNPVLTHNNYESPISTIGHADIVQTQNNEWYAVMLGVRKVEGKTIMGRETFLTSFVWEDGWPKFNPKGGGKVLTFDQKPNLPWTPISPEQAKPLRDEFRSEQLNPVWNFYHTPHEKWWETDNTHGKLKIALQSPATTEQTNIPVIARRITEANFKAVLSMQFDPQNEKEQAGLIVLMNQNGQYRLQVTRKGSDKVVQLVKYVHYRKRKETTYETIAEKKVEGKTLILKLEANGLDYQFLFGETEGTLRTLGTVQDGSIISKEAVGGYSGAYVGMFGSSNGSISDNEAIFDWFEYEVKSN